MITLGIVTTSRADFGIYLPLLHAIKADAALQLRLFVSGTHLSDTHGRTERLITDSGFEIDHRIAMPMATDSPDGVAAAIAAGVEGFTQVLSDHRPDLLLVLGDRFEMLCPALAALPLRIPVAHIHGGETTHGAMDESLRHAITKLSHLHFASHATHAGRLVRMGEQPDRVIVSGAPSLDTLSNFKPFDRATLADRLGLPLNDPYAIVTFHPTTLDSTPPELQVDALFQALAELDLSLVFSRPNADPGSRAIYTAIHAFAAAQAHAVVLPELGQRGYFSLMHHAAVMVGNSSSGIIEAASFGLPVVNIGDRQAGRTRADNVIDVPCDRDAIVDAITQATSETFAESVEQLTNPYGDGHAAQRIIDAIKAATLTPEFVIKPFYDGPVPQEWAT